MLDVDIYSATIKNTKYSSCRLEDKRMKNGVARRLCIYMMNFLEIGDNAELAIADLIGRIIYKF